MFGAAVWAATRVAHSHVPPEDTVGLWLQVVRCLRTKAVKVKPPEIDERILPKVAIIGRPNVGKSQLFNRLVRQQTALVYDTPNSHVTRDYKDGRAQLGDLHFKVMDTSGLEPRKPLQSIQGRATNITARALQQTHLAMLVLDAKDGVMPHDAELAKWLRRFYPVENVLLVANKAESSQAQKGMLQTTLDCFALGYGEPVAISAATNEGMADLYTALQPRIDALMVQLAHSHGVEVPNLAGRANTRKQYRHVDETTAPLTKEQRRSLLFSEPRVPLVDEAVTGASGGSSSSAGTGGDGGAENTGRSSSSSTAGSQGLRSKGVRSNLHGAGAAVQEAEESEDEGEDAETEGRKEERYAGPIRLAIMGVPNVGKSTLMNRLLGDERSMTGPEPGLTRDAVRANWDYDGMPIELVDTAGWIGQTKTGNYDDVGGAVADLTRQDGARALAAVSTVVLVLDSENALRTQRVMSHRELVLASTVLEEGKALIIVANKIDVLKRDDRALYISTLREKLEERFLEAGQVPVVEVSALTGSGLEALMPQVLESYQNWNRRVKTGRLNRFVRKLAVRLTGSGTDTMLARLKFMTQIKARPPSFTAFMTGSEPATVAFSRFLSNQLRDVLNFQGVPVRIWFRYKEKKSERMQRRSRDRERAAAPRRKAARAEEHASKKSIALSRIKTPGGGASDVGRQEKAERLKVLTTQHADILAKGAEGLSAETMRMVERAARGSALRSSSDSARRVKAGQPSSSSSSSGGSSHATVGGSPKLQLSDDGGGVGSSFSAATTGAGAAAAGRRTAHRRPALKPSQELRQWKDEHSGANATASISTSYDAAAASAEWDRGSQHHSSLSPPSFKDRSSSGRASGSLYTSSGTLRKPVSPRRSTTDRDSGVDSSDATAAPHRSAISAQQHDRVQQDGAQQPAVAEKLQSNQVRALAMVSRKPSAPVFQPKKAVGTKKLSAPYMMRQTKKQRAKDAAWGGE